MTSCSSRVSDYDLEPGGVWKSASRPPHTLPFLRTQGKAVGCRGLTNTPPCSWGNSFCACRWLSLLGSLMRPSPDSRSVCGQRGLPGGAGLGRCWALPPPPRLCCHAAQRGAIGITVCIDSCVYMCPGPSEAQGAGPTAPRDLPSKPTWPVPPPSPHTPTSPATSAPGHAHGAGPHFWNALLYTVQTHTRVRQGDGASPSAPTGCAVSCAPPSSSIRPPTGALTPEAAPAIRGGVAGPRRAGRRGGLECSGVGGRSSQGLPLPLRRGEGLAPAQSEPLVRWPCSRDSSSCPQLAGPLGRSGLPVPESWRLNLYFPERSKAYLLTQRQHPLPPPPPPKAAALTPV